MRKHIPCAKSYNLRESPGGPLIRTLSFHRGGTGLIPGILRPHKMRGTAKQTKVWHESGYSFRVFLFFSDFLFYIGSIANSSDSFLFKSPNEGWSCRWPQKERNLSLQDRQRLSPPATSLPSVSILPTPALHLLKNTRLLQIKVSTWSLVSDQDLVSKK